MRYLYFFILMAFCSSALAYETKWINKIEQLNATDMDLVVSEDGKEIRRAHRSFEGEVTPEALEAEALKEINAIENQEVPVDPVFQQEFLSEVTRLEDQVGILTQQNQLLNASLAAKTLELDVKTEELKDTIDVLAKKEAELVLVKALVIEEPTK